MKRYASLSPPSIRQETWIFIAKEFAAAVSVKSHFLISLLGCKIVSYFFSM
jgi:hypothetical protein